MDANFVASRFTAVDPEHVPVVGERSRPDASEDDTARLDALATTLAAAGVLTGNPERVADREFEATQVRLRSNGG